MLFDLRPKTSFKELFDRNEEKKAFENSLNTYPLIVVTGLRRVGKSSLTKSMLNEMKSPYVFIDGRILYTSSGGQIKYTDFVATLERELCKLSTKFKIKSYIKQVRGINISGSGVSIDPKKTDLTELFDQLNRYSKKTGKDFVVCIDEAQYLRFYGSRGGKDLLTLISYMYDNQNHISTVITGSEVGLLHDFLDLSNYESPLYGRAYSEIKVKPFKPNVAKEFLKEGFSEINLSINFKLDKVIEVLDGIPGYLVLFGNKYKENLNYEEAILQVHQTMKGMVEGELKELEKRSSRYIMTLKYIASGVKTWSGLKRVFIADGDNIGDSRLYEILRVLETTSWIEKSSDNKYKIVDPVLEKVLRE